MIIIEPVQIPRTYMISSSLPIADYPFWQFYGTYQKGARCCVGSDFEVDVYERLITGGGSVPPPDDADNWSKVGPSMRYAPFDYASSTKAISSTGPLTWQFYLPQSLDTTGIFIEDVYGSSVTIVVTDGAQQIYSRTVQLTTSVVGSVFGQTRRLRNVVLLDLPNITSSDAKLTITVAGTNCWLGRFVIGNWWGIGDTKFGVATSITSYSVREVDSYGNPTLTKRPAADEFSFPVRIATVDVGEVKYRLKQLDADFLVFIGSVDFEWMAVYGWFTDFRTDIEYPKISHCTLKVQGAI